MNRSLITPNWNKPPKWSSSSPVLTNNYLSKLRRSITSLLSIDKNRKGNCINCGECCKLPNTCPFLKDNHCSIYSIRPLNCRKYPRTNREHITKDTCGFEFNES